MPNNRLKNLNLDLVNDKESRPLVVSVVSGKGGVGKSVISFNLASHIAAENSSALLIDTDLAFGNQHILANINPEFSLVDYLQGDVDYEKIIIDLSSNLQLIGSESSFDYDTSRIAEQIETGLINIINSTDKDFVIIDTPSASIDAVKAVSRLFDIILIVINPELTSIADGYGLFKYLSKINAAEKGHIFVNRSDNESDVSFIYQKFSFLAQKFLNRVPLYAGRLFDDMHIIDAIARQKPVCELFNNSPAVKSLDNLFKLLTENREIKDRQHDKRVQDEKNINRQHADIKG